MRVLDVLKGDGKFMSKNFPHWLTADIILPQLVERYCRLAIESNENDVNIGLLDPEIIWLVPPEDREKFQQIYIEFASLMMQLLEPMLDRYIGTTNEPKNIHCLKADVENVLQSLKQHCGYTYKDILLMMLLEGEEERKQIISMVLQLQPVPIFHLRGCWELKPVP
jgi:hypothetical protein